MEVSVAVGRSSSGQFLHSYSNKEGHLQPGSSVDESVVAEVVG